MSQPSDRRSVAPQRPRSTLGDRLAAARTACSHSPEAISGHLGVGDDTIAAWESGDAVPSAHQVRMIAGVLDVPVTWLLSGESDDEPVSPTAQVEPGSDRKRGLAAAMKLVRHDLTRTRRRLRDLEKQLDQAL